MEGPHLEDLRSILVAKNVRLHQQTNPHGHIVYIIANSNISYFINVMFHVHGKKFCPSIGIL